MAMTQLGLGSTVPQIIQGANTNLAELDSSKADKVTNGRFHDIAILDADGNLATSARTIDSLENQINENSLNKADKVSGAVAGNLATLDAGGNLTDSGKKPSDFVQSVNGIEPDGSGNVDLGDIGGEPIGTFTEDDSRWGTSMGIPSIRIQSSKKATVVY